MGHVSFWEKSIKGMIWNREAKEFEPVKSIKKVSEVYPFEESKYFSKDLYDRQIRLWGEEGQKKINKLHVGIVGCGGLGAIIAEELARIGVKNFTLVDGDIVEESNLTRLTGVYRESLNKAKVEALASNIYRINSKSKVTKIPEMLSHDKTHMLKYCDVLIGCVDSEGARLILNEISIRFLIPYFDVGTGIKVDKNLNVIQMGGQVRFVNPGSTPCLQCYGGIDPFEASIDLMTKEERGIRESLGYVDGLGTTPEPSIIPLNAILASICVQELVKFVTKFDRVFPYIHYDALNNKIVIPSNEIKNFKPSKVCPVCVIGGYLGLGDLECERFILDEDIRKLKSYLGKAGKSDIYS